MLEAKSELSLGGGGWGIDSSKYLITNINNNKIRDSLSGGSKEGKLVQPHNFRIFKRVFF
jgi:hypothetical protein